MEKIKSVPVGTALEVERAITPRQRRKILDAGDLLITIGGLSKDRNRYRKKERPRRKGYRAYRNRAIVYALIETGMRRAEITRINIDDVDFTKGVITVSGKGGLTHSYLISHQGLEAIKDYVEKEREKDCITWQSSALF